MASFGGFAPAPNPGATLNYVAPLLDMWYDHIRLNGDIGSDAPSDSSQPSFDSASSSSSSSDPVKSAPTTSSHDHVLSESFALQALGVSRELRNKFPLGSSVLLQRAFLSPQSLVSSLQNLTIRHAIEYWLLSRQVEAHWSIAAVSDFVSSILAFKFQVEIIDAYVDLVILNEEALKQPSITRPVSGFASPSSIPTAYTILLLLANSLPTTFDPELSKQSMHRLWKHNLKRYNALLTSILPKPAPNSFMQAPQLKVAYFGGKVPPKMPATFGASSTGKVATTNAGTWPADLRLKSFKSLMTALERLPHNATLGAMGQRFPCHTGLLYLAWPYFRHFLSLSASSSSIAHLPASDPSHNAPLQVPLDSHTNPPLHETKAQDTEQNDAATVFLNFGDRLLPEAVKSLLEFFKNGVVPGFNDYLAAKSILRHAEELRLVDDNGKGLPGFLDLIAHLNAVQPYKNHMPAQNCFYALAFAMQTHDKQVWDDSLKSFQVHGYGSHGDSDSANWFHQTHPEAHWLATWSLLSGKTEYPFNNE